MPPHQRRMTLARRFNAGGMTWPIRGVAAATLEWLAGKFKRRRRDAACLRRAPGVSTPG
jgi:hypothetical protein